MQQELIEMLEEIIQYVEVWHHEDGEALDRAEALIKKAKNNAPAVPQGEPEAYMVYGNYTRQPFRSIESAQAYIGGLLKSDPEGGYHIRPLFYATPAAPSQEPALHIGACITDGVLHATVMRREANGHVTILAKAEMDAKSLLERDCLAEMSRATPSQPDVPQGFKPVGYLRSAEFDGHVFEPIGGTWPFDELLFSLSTSPEPVQEVTLTDGLIEKGAMTGMVDAQIDDIIAALREKEQAK